MTKPPTLYEILGITPDADPAAVKKAWRSVAARTHPDKRNGDRDDFEQAHHAYLVLKNPELREEYDRTGVDPGVKVDNEQAILLQNIIRLMQKYIQQPGYRDGPVDILKAMVADLDQEDIVDRRTIEQIEQSIASIRKIQKRFRKKDRKSVGPNLLVMACQGQISQCEAAQRTPRENIAFRVKIRECLANYAFEVAPMLASQSWAMGAISTGGNYFDQGRQW